LKLLKRNTTVFQYRAYAGETETLRNNLHGGNIKPTYAAPVEYRGTISAPSGFVSTQLFGIDTDYTHVLLMDDVNTPIDEAGLIDWNGSTYMIRAVRPSLNVLAIALKKKTDGG